MSALHDITERGMALMVGKDDELKERLLEAHDLFAALEGQFPAILEQLEATRNSRLK